jgi:hypothetical protein
VGTRVGAGRVEVGSAVGVGDAVVGAGRANVVDAGGSVDPDCADGALLHAVATSATAATTTAEIRTL